MCVWGCEWGHGLEAIKAWEMPKGKGRGQSEGQRVGRWHPKKQHLIRGSLHGSPSPHRTRPRPARPGLSGPAPRWPGGPLTPYPVPFSPPGYFSPGQSGRVSDNEQKTRPGQSRHRGRREGHGSGGPHPSPGPPGGWEPGLPGANAFFAGDKERWNLGGRAAQRGPVPPVFYNGGGAAAMGRGGGPAPDSAPQTRLLFRGPDRGRHKGRAGRGPPVAPTCGSPGGLGAPPA